MEEAIALIVNRKHEARIPLNRWEVFCQRFPGAVFFYTDYVGHAMQLAERAAREGFRFLVALGGDGTVNEVVNGIMALPPALRGEVRLAIVPVGSGNDFVRSSGLGHSLESLEVAIRTDRPVFMDVGSISHIEEVGKPVRYFANIADAGIGGLVAGKMRSLLNWLPATLAYQVSILRSFLSFRHPRVRLNSDTFQYTGKLLSLCAANGQWFGSGLGIAPHADIQDGQLAFVVLGDVSLSDYLRHLPAVRKKSFISHPHIQYHKGQFCEIEILEGDCLLEADGEYLGKAPVRMGIHPGAISLLLFPLLLLMLSPWKSLAQPVDRKLEAAIEKTIAGFRGDLGLSVLDIRRGRSVHIRSDSVYPTASIVKVPILMGITDKLRQGTLDYHRKLIYRDSLHYEGEDILASFRDGESIELSKVIMLMLTTSDNTASLWLQSLAGNGSSVNALLADLGFEHTRINSRTFGRERQRDKYGWGQSTPREMVQIFVRMFQGKLLGGEWDASMIRRLGRNYWDEEALGEIPAGVFTASKNGAVNASRSEVVLVNHPRRPYVFCIMTANNIDRSWERENEAWVLTRRLSSLLWEYFDR